MTRLVIAAIVTLAAAATITLLVTFAHGNRAAEPVAALIPTRTPTPAVPEPTPLPKTWLDGVRVPHSGAAVMLSCFDADGDARLSGADGALFDGVRLGLDPAKACVDAAAHADFYVDDVAAPACGGADPAPVLVVLAGGGGSDLMQASEGESLGLLDIYNQLRSRTAAAGIPVETIISTAAVLGGVPAQGDMEAFLAAQIAQRLDAAPCLRAVIVGHSHGGVIVTAVAAGIEDRFAPRLFGVLIDRSAALYDGDPDAMPVATRLLNVFQLNEGWHGIPIDAPNITNLDQSLEYAPLAPSDGASGLARVSHKTLDDSPAVQSRVVDAIMTWLAATAR